MAQEMSIKRVLLSDVAKLAGLSKATLSRYMNNSIVLPQETITPESLQAAIHHGLETAQAKQQAMAQSPMQNGTENVLRQIKAAAGWEE